MARATMDVVSAAFRDVVEAITPLDDGERRRALAAAICICDSSVSELVLKTWNRPRVAEEPPR